MKKKIVMILISALFLIGLLPATAFAANWKPTDEITVKIRIFNPDNGGTWVVGTDACTKGDEYVQSDDYTIPPLSKFIGENSYRVQSVAGNWYFPAGDRNVGSVVNWSCNSSEATMTYWVPGYTPAGSTGGGSSGSDTEESGSGNYSMTYKIIYHSNYPDGTDYTQEYDYIIRAGYNIGNTGRTVSVKTVAQVGFTAPSGYALASTPWNKQADGNGDGVDSMVYVKPNSTTHLYAQWVPGEVSTKVALKYMNGDEQYGETQSYLAGDTVHVINCTAEKEGFVFKGWDANAAASNVVYEADAQFVINANTVLYAVWEAQTTYTVTYTDGVDGEEVFADQVYSDLLSGTATPAFNGNPEREGYVFGGWNPAVAETVTGNVTYVATWKEDKNHNGIPDDEEQKYTIKYTDGANGTIFEDQIYEDLLVGMPVPAFEGTPERVGYVFAGWGSDFSDTVEGNVVYIATWEKIPETGDSSDLMLWFAIMLAAGTAMAGTVVCSRKKNVQR